VAVDVSEERSALIFEGKSGPRRGKSVVIRTRILVPVGGWAVRILSSLIIPAGLLDP
jgi:hypothetical protein